MNFTPIILPAATLLSIIGIFIGGDIWVSGGSFLLAIIFGALTYTYFVTDHPYGWDGDYIPGIDYPAYLEMDETDDGWQNRTNRKHNRPE